MRTESFIMRSVHSSSDVKSSSELDDRRNADRIPSQQLADVICRQAGPESSLVTYPGFLADVSVEGAKLVCQQRILHHAIWIRYTPQNGPQQVIEGSIRWCRMAGDGPENGWVYGVRFTSPQKVEALPSPALTGIEADLAESVLDDSENISFGDTQIWSKDRAKLLAEYLQAAPRPSVVRPDSFALQGLFQSPTGSERRISPRYACERSGQIRAQLDSEEILTIATEDISEHGAKILSPEPIHGEHLFLYLPSISGFPTPVECEIRWRCNQVEGLFCQETRYSYGLRFLSPLPHVVVEMLRARQGKDQ